MNSRKPSRPSSPFSLASKLFSLFLVASILGLESTHSLRARESEASSDRPLSHEVLFAPNKTFPYFERFPKPQAVVAFSLGNAATLSQCCLLSYVKENKFIEETLAKAGFDQVVFFENKGTFAFLAECNDALVLAFRGTETGDQADYFADAKIVQRLFQDKGAAHSGFIDALSWVSDDINRTLAEIQTSEEKPLWITGHSLGAALATLFGIQYDGSIAGIYTIAGPRVGGISLADYASEAIPLYRIVKGNDIIPRLPSPPFYKHIGSTYYIASDGSLLVDPPLLERWKSQAQGHKELLEQVIEEHWSKKDFSAIPSDYFVDHSPRLYVEAIVELAAKKE